MNLPKKYYPTYWSGCNPIHEVNNWAKVRKLVRDAIKGHKITPILIEGDRNNGSLLTGTHRAAANDILMMLGKDDFLIPYATLDSVKVTPELQEALDNNDYQAINNLFDL